MQFSLATMAIVLAHFAVAFDPAKDTCVPDPHIFQGGSTPGLIPCTPKSSSSSEIARFSCGNLGDVNFNPMYNTVSVFYSPAPNAKGTFRRNLYGSCKQSTGAQIAHVSLSTPLLKSGITAQTFPGFNRLCQSNTERLSITFSLYDLTHKQLEQCYAHPLIPGH